MKSLIFKVFLNFFCVKSLLDIMEKPNLCSTSAVGEIFQFDFVALDSVSTSNSQNSEKKGKKKAQQHGTGKKHPQN